MADGNNGFSKFHKLRCCVRVFAGRINCALVKDRVERILRKDMFDIGHEQLLMLLLMVHAENEERFELVQQTAVRAGEEIVDMRIDGSAIAMRFLDGGPGDEAAEIAPVHVAGGVVIGIKK